LRTALPQKNGIQPLYVHAELKPAQLKPKTLRGATFKVLAPEFDIDTYYLGEGGAETLHGLGESTGLLRGAPATSPTSAVPTSGVCGRG